MGKNSLSKELIIVLFAAIILTISYIYPDTNNPTNFIIVFGAFLLIILTNVIAKRFTAYRLESNVETKFWELYQFGFAEKEHFKKPLPMIWLSLLLSFISKGIIVWMPILSFDITPRVERVSRRHELYRFAEVTDWHLALVVFWGIMANIALYVIMNLIGLKELAVLSLYYAIWSIMPIGSLDGTKLLFGNRKLWLTAGVLILIAFVWQSMLF